MWRIWIFEGGGATVTEYERFERALSRNLDEVVRAILAYRTLAAIEETSGPRGIDFIQLAYWALFNDMFAHSMRLLDKHKDSASFWFLHKSEQPKMDRIIEGASIDFQGVTSMSTALKLVRDKTHFHIDRNAVVAPKEIWQKAAIKGPELKCVLDDVFIILNTLHEEMFEKDFWLPDCDGSDVKEIIKISQKAGVIF